MTETHPDIRRTLLFACKDDQVLLAMKKRGFGVGKWNGVGGKIETGESIEEALVREAIEEVNITPTKYIKVAELDFIQDADTPNPWHMYVHAYMCHEWNGNPQESEEMAPKWFDINQIPYDEMWDDDRYWLNQVLDSQKLVGRFIFDAKDKMIRHQIKLISPNQNFNDAMKEFESQPYDKA